MKRKYKLWRISRKNFFLSFTNLILISFAVAIAFILLTKVVVPVLRDANDGQNIYNEFQSILNKVEQDPNYIWTFFNTDIIKDIANNPGDNAALIQDLKIKYAQVQALQKQFEEILANFNDPAEGYLKFFNESVDWIQKAVNEITSPVGQTGNSIVLLPLVNTGEQVLKQMHAAKTLVNSVNDLASNWLNLKFDDVFSDLVNGNQDFTKHINTVLKSKGFILAAAAASALVSFLLNWLTLLFSSLIFIFRNKKLYDLKLSPTVVGLNFLLNFLFIFGWLTWIILWTSMRKKIKETDAQEEFNVNFNDQNLLSAATQTAPINKQVKIQQHIELKSNPPVKATFKAGTFNEDFSSTKTQKFVSDKTQELYADKSKKKTKTKEKEKNQPSFTDFYR